MRVAVAIGCLLVSAACAACASENAPSITLTRASIPGIGATRADWNATHTPNPAYNNGSVYGDDPSLPSYIAPHGGVYIEVSDLGMDRIQAYTLNMQTLDRADALARVKRELPSDATVAWDLKLDQCYRVGFNSATLAAATQDMAVVQLEDTQQDGSAAVSPDSFNQASFMLGVVGSRPDPDTGC